MDQIPLPTLKVLSSILTWAAFWFAIGAAVTGWLSAQVRSETSRRADLRVATAEQAAAEASSAAATANSKTEAIRADNLATQERLITAERALESERAERIKLEMKLAPRRISSQDAKALKARLGGLTHARETPVSVAVFSTSETGEAQMFASSLATAFQQCGFTINRNTVHYGKPYALLGVGVLTSTDPDCLARGQAIASALNEIGIASQMLPPREASAGDADGTYIYNQAVSLMVGDRPA